MNFNALCFVDMPFGQKPDLKSGVAIDFDQIYNEAIKPAIEECGLEALRGDDERTGRMIHGAMFARLLLAEFVVVDLTLANANVFYELGIRHAARPFTTVPIFANVSALPFDVALVRAVSYELKKGSLTKDGAQKLKSQLAKRLCDAISGAPTPDSPLFQLIPKFPGIDLPDEVTETFKDRIRQAEEFRDLLSSARALPLRGKREALLRIRRDLGDLKTVQRSVLIELMSSFRDAEAFEELVELYNSFSAPLKDYVFAKQQFALALSRRNQLDDREKALRILNELLKNRGSDSETLEIKGRIHKDTYKEASQRGRVVAAAALDDAIDAYTKGFEADPRDYYPGVNAINLLIQKGDAEALKEVERLLPLVSFAVARRGGAWSGDYWDLATVLELACISEDWPTANRVLPKVLTASDSFKTATTLDNLRLLKEARERAGREVTELDRILNDLSARCVQSQRSSQFAFVSYAREDAEFVLRLAKDLRAGGANVWIDQLDIWPGQRWDRVVEGALAKCSQLLVILSPAAAESTNVIDEVSLALDSGKTVLPVMHRGCKIPFSLRRLQYVDFTLNYDAGLGRLLETLGVAAPGTANDP
jgi:hypothetical protein